MAAWFEERLLHHGENWQKRIESNIQRIIGVMPLAYDEIRIAPEKDWIHFDFGVSQVTLRSPLYLLKQKRQLLEKVEIPFMNTSGHLYGDNILTDGVYCWLTDFRDAGLSPILRDYLSLEALARFQWVHIQNTVEIHALEELLVIHGLQPAPRGTLR